MSRALVSVYRVPETTPRLLINKEKSGQQVRMHLLLGNALYWCTCSVLMSVSGSFDIIIIIFFFGGLSTLPFAILIKILNQLAYYVFLSVTWQVVFFSVFIVCICILD